MHTMICSTAILPPVSGSITACQSCHGPGEAHVAWAKATQEGKPIVTGKRASHGLLVDYRKGDSRYEVDSCGACHSRRQRLTDGDLPGAPYLDNYQPALLREGLYHPDGQQQDEVYVYGSMLQSRMHQKGVRCTDCHEAHTLKLKAEGKFEGAEEIITIDGVRVEYKDGFGLARPSNTTPVVVLRFEADNAVALERIQAGFRSALQAVWPGIQLPF
jgi:phosphomannomutase